MYVVLINSLLISCLYVLFTTYYPPAVGQTIFLSVIGIATLLVAIIGATFAYFTTTMTGENQGKINVGSAKLPAISYTAEAITASNIYPGWTSEDKTATITVAAGGAGTFEYECNLEVTTNEKFKDLKLTVTAGTGAEIDTGVQSAKTLSSADGAEGVQTIKLASGTITTTGDSVSHNFKYKIDFEDNNDNQNDQQEGNLVAQVICKLSGEAHYTQSNQSGD